MKEVPELLLINKPRGISSMGVIRRLRTMLGIRKIGHAGTLDPLAEGLMLVGVGAGTKKLTELIKLDKEYVAKIRIGEQRSTGDLEGYIVAEKEVTESLEKLQSMVEDALASMIDTITLPVSAYSAIKVDGVPMYKRARKAEKKGEVVIEVPVRDMQVDEAELLALEIAGGRAVATVRFAVASGTYIRSLAEELGRRIQYPATLQSLTRTKVSSYTLSDALSLEEVESLYR